MDVVVRTLVDTAPGGDGLVRRRVEVPPGSRVEAAAGPGGELWYVIDGAGQLAAPFEQAREQRVHPLEVVVELLAAAQHRA